MPKQLSLLPAMKTPTKTAPESITRPAIPPDLSDLQRGILAALERHTDWVTKTMLGKERECAETSFDQRRAALAQLLSRGLIAVKKKPLGHSSRSSTWYTPLYRAELPLGKLDELDRERAKRAEIAWLIRFTSKS